jgi:DNA-binding SARP family transcriptional activator
LGALRVTLDDQPVSGFRTQKARALLAYLAVEARPHERDHLAGLLWAERPDPIARTYLRQALANLRRILDYDLSERPFPIGLGSAS